MKVAALLIALALLSSAPTASPDKPFLHLLSGQLPMYPRIAQTAHITGEVIASFSVQEGCSVSSVRIESGPPVLWHATEDSIQTWKFSPDGLEHCTTLEDRTTFVYKIKSNKDVANAFSLTMTSYRHIEVSAPAPELLVN